MPRCCQEPRDSTTHQGHALSSLGRQELEQKKRRGKEIAPPCDCVCRCIPRCELQLQEESWGSMALLTVEGEVLGPPCKRLCCLCWTCFSPLPVSVGFWGGQRWPEGARGGCRERSCPGQRDWCRAALPLPSTCKVSHQGRALSSLLMLKV